VSRELALALDLEADRLQRLVVEVGPLRFDFSKQLIRTDELDQALALGGFLPDAIGELLRGEPVNGTERRPAQHTALRAEADSLSPPDLIGHAENSRAAMLDFVDALRASAIHGASGESLDTVVNIGIGGSDLGPRLGVAALKHLDPAGPRIENLNNVDGHAAHALLGTLNPRRTLIVYVSKSYTTQETQLNLQLVRAWIDGALGDGALKHQLAVVTSKPALARSLEVPDSRIFPMFDWVGGRYSLWSTVGLSIALAVGRKMFLELLSGAAAMDRHFASAPLARNAPVLGALIERHQRQQFPARAVLPYDSRLALLPEYLQQLEMESNGKRVRRDGSAVAESTNALVFGTTGTNAQHAYVQQIHQGTDPIPVEFIGVVKPDHPHRANHRALLANLLAQAAALWRGKTEDEAEQDMLRSGLSSEDATRLKAHRAFPGGRPSTTILIDRLNAHALGALLAYYEHKVYVASRLLDINAFDQWGVELGKVLTESILPRLDDNAPLDGYDPGTRTLIERLRRS
jgi:glucose-6-phosphate isomerase